MPKKTIADFFAMKERGEKITSTVVYDYHMAHFAEQAGIDWLHAGDSVGMAVYGMKGTMPVTMEQMIAHSNAVRKGAPNTYISGDMPFGSYHESISQAVKNATRFFKEAEVDCVKLEGGCAIAPQIKAIVEAGMPVQGHIGITPQYALMLGGFKAQGVTAEAALRLLEDAKAIEEAGAFSVVLEGVPPEVAKYITQKLKAITFGAGSGPHCDAQALLSIDLLGIFEDFTPKFAKKYVNLAEEIRNAFKTFHSDIKELRFPEEKHCYKMKAGEAEKLETMMKT